MVSPPGKFTNDTPAMKKCHIENTSIQYSALGGRGVDSEDGNCDTITVAVPFWVYIRIPCQKG